jgi:hypothetical protein
VKQALETRTSNQVLLHSFLSICFPPQSRLTHIVSERVLKFLAPLYVRITGIRVEDFVPTLAPIPSVSNAAIPGIANIEVQRFLLLTPFSAMANN